MRSKQEILELMRKYDPECPTIQGHTESLALLGDAGVL